MVNDVCVCVFGTYVVRLCVGKDAICLILAVGYVTLVLFLKTVKKQNSTICVDAYHCIWCVRFFVLEGVLRMNV